MAFLYESENSITVLRFDSRLYLFCVLFMAADSYVMLHQIK